MTVRFHFHAYRVGQIKRHHFTFLLVTNERMYQILWFWQVQISDLKLSKELKEKLLGSDRGRLGIGLGLGNKDRWSEPDRQSEAINFAAC